jgi:hypothetical protein
MGTEDLIFATLMVIVGLLLMVAIIILLFSPDPMIDERPVHIDKGNCSVETQCYMVGKVMSCNDVTRCDVIYSDTSEIKCRRCTEV